MPRAKSAIIRKKIAGDGNQDRKRVHTEPLMETTTVTNELLTQTPYDETVASLTKENFMDLVIKNCLPPAFVEHTLYIGVTNIHWENWFPLFRKTLARREQRNWRAGLNPQDARNYGIRVALLETFMFNVTGYGYRGNFEIQMALHALMLECYTLATFRAQIYPILLEIKTAMERAKETFKKWSAETCVRYDLVFNEILARFGSMKTPMIGMHFVYRGKNDNGEEEVIGISPPDYRDP